MADADTIPTVTVEWAPLGVGATKPATAKGRGIYVPVEYLAHEQAIWECRECMAWEAQVDVHDGQVWVREWHAEDCTILQIIRQGICHGNLAPGTYCPRCGAYNTDEPEG